MKNEQTGDRFSWLAMLPIVALFLAHVWMFRGFVLDDTFISFRYIQQWVHGNGLVYNIGERVEGYSNFLWVVLLAPFAWAGFDLLVVSKIVGLGCSLLVLLQSWLLVRHLRLSMPFLTPFLLACSAPFAVWSVGGMETPLFTLLLVTSILLFLREEEQQRGFLAGVALGLLCLTRPDGLLFAATTVLFRAGRLWQQRMLPTRQDWLRGSLLLLIVGTHIVWRLSYYGYLLPNTVYAKSMGLHPRALVEGFYYLATCCTEVGGIGIVAIGTALALTSKEHAFVPLYLFLNSAAYVGAVVVGGGDWMPLCRFLVHILPLVWVLVHIGINNLERIWNHPRRNAWLNLILLAQAGYLLAISLDHRINERIGTASASTAVRPGLAYLRTHVQPGDTVAVIYAGYAYDLPLDVRVIDMVGLNDEHIAHLPAQFPGGIMGKGNVFGKWDAAYVLAQDPRYIQGGVPTRTASGEWRTGFTGTTILLNDPLFQSAYQRVEDPTGHGLFVRADSLSSGQPEGSEKP